MRFEENNKNVSINENNIHVISNSVTQKLSVLFLNNFLTKMSQRGLNGESHHGNGGEQPAQFPTHDP
jgi:hypothetical protein